MGALTARFFARLQGAAFYHALLEDALALLPAGDGRTLLDIGCGPGALARLAAARGYHATGIDIDPAMIALARRIAGREHSTATFALADLNDAPNIFPAADAVAAASLLAVVPCPAEALHDLWQCVAPGGALLILEPSEQMNPANARHLLATVPRDSGSPLLTLWAHARQGHTINPRLFDTISESSQRRDTPLLHGLVRATLLKRPVATPSAPAGSAYMRTRRPAREPERLRAPRLSR